MQLMYEAEFNTIMKAASKSVLFRKLDYLSIVLAVVLCLNDWRLVLRVVPIRVVTSFVLDTSLMLHEQGSSSMKHQLLQH